MAAPLDRMLTGDPVSKDEFRAAEPNLRNTLLHVQEELLDRDFPVVIVLGGPDFTGCEEVFERLHQWFDARYLRSDAFGRPSDFARARPWLWRYWKSLPPRGTVGLFLRGWATAAVGHRVLGDWDADRLTREVAHLRHLEEMLVADGALVLKFWLHVSRKKLKKRLAAARKKDAWRVPQDEEKVHEIYDDAKPVIEQVLTGTDGLHAPWIVVDGSDRWFRNLTVAGRIAEEMQLHLARAVPAPAEPPPDRLAVDPDTALDDVDLSARLDEDHYDDRMDELRNELSELHREACARDVGMVLAFEGWDASGKGGVIRRVTQAMDATRYKVFPIAAPDERERSRHWLWRFWNRVPGDGTVAVFDRSWYGRVLVERVEGFARRDEWERAYEDIEDFEAQLVEHGHVVAKFLLHISPEEQMRRFESREEISFKRHKITAEDWRNRDRWHDYEVAMDEMVARTSGAVRWNVIPADDKRFARVEVLQRVCDALRTRLRRKD